VNEQLARESHQLQDQKIHKLRVAMEVQVYGAAKVTTSKQTQYPVYLTRARQAESKWSQVDRKRAIERLERKLNQITVVKSKLFDKLFQYHERQRLQQVGTKATGPCSTFTKKIAQMKNAAEGEVYGVVTMTADKCVEFQIHLSDVEAEATTCSITDTDRIVSQLE